MKIKNPLRLAIPALLAAQATLVFANSPYTATADPLQPYYQQLVTQSLEKQQGRLDLSKVPDVADVDILAINQEIKDFLDQQVRPIPGLRERAFMLHNLLFRPYYLGITYDDSQTYTAQETFDKGAGNCISHASLFVAAARYVGLKAKFQVVEVPRDWVQSEDYYIVPGHINVAVYIPGNKITVEFSDVYLAQHTQFFKSKAVSDTRALAEYYNNRGMEAMQLKDYLSAIAYMQKSLKTHRNSGFVWSNLGVVYKINGHMAEAQQAYERGLKLDKRNLSIINNAYILYYQTGQLDKAQSLAAKVESYSKKNPYYLAKLASADINLHNYKQAVTKLKRAISKKPEEPAFHFTLSHVYYLLGNQDLAVRQLQIGQKNAINNEDQQRFQHKLNLLQHYQAGL